MSKGLIMEVKEQDVIVLTPEGEFRSIGKQHAIWQQVGDEIDVPAQYEVPFIKKKGMRIPSFVAIAASILLLFVSTFSFLNLGEAEEIGYVHVDINPSIKLGINNDLEVVRVDALNEDGKKLIDALGDWSSKSVDEFTTEVIDLAEQKGFLQVNHDVLLSSSFVDLESEERYQKKLDEVMDKIEENIVQASAKIEQTRTQSTNEKQDHENVQTPEKDPIKVHRLLINKELRDEAQEIGVSPGKYSIYLVAVENGVEIDIEDVKKLSVSKLLSISNIVERAKNVGVANATQIDDQDEHREDQREKEIEKGEKRNSIEEKNKKTSTKEVGREEEKAEKHQKQQGKQKEDKQAQKNNHTQKEKNQGKKENKIQIKSKVGWVSITLNEDHSDEENQKNPITNKSKFTEDEEKDRPGKKNGNNKRDDEEDSEEDSEEKD
jgi:hypothetical protein